jgi:hypothetical protein
MLERFEGEKTGVLKEEYFGTAMKFEPVVKVMSSGNLTK